MASPVMISHSDGGGGADRAAFGILQSVGLHEPDASMLVAKKLTTDQRVKTFDELVGTESVWKSALRTASEELPLYLQKSSNPVHRSFNVVPRGIGSIIQALRPSAIHLHWLGQGTMSIREIGALTGPVVWTLHDSWPFCGAEHHPENDVDRRFRDSYSRKSRQPGNSRLDVDAWTYRRKVRLWTQPRWLVGPSKWMVEQARSSSLAHDWPSSVIPNPINSDTFSPTNIQEARNLWGISPDVNVALFGGMGADSVKGKGWDLLEESIGFLSASDMPWEVWTFGGRAGDWLLNGIPVRSVGVVNDPRRLATLYSAADVHVVPSRVESFSQTAAEAIACGTPVVAYRVGGLPEVVHDERVGILVDPFDTQAFATAMARAVSLKPTTFSVGPEMAKAWRPEEVGRRYLETYLQAGAEWERRLRSKPQS